jgi:hypothetical protein
MAFIRYSESSDDFNDDDYDGNNNKDFKHSCKLYILWLPKTL